MFLVGLTGSFGLYCVLVQTCTCPGADFTDLAEIGSRIEPVQSCVAADSTTTLIHSR